MPYIKKERRQDLNFWIEDLASKIESEGELNYVFTRLAHLFTTKLQNKRWPGYKSLNAVMGVFESAKLEFYRRRVAPYEDEKIIENGDVKQE